MKYFVVLSCILTLLLPVTGFAHGTRSFMQQHSDTEIKKPASAPVPERFQLAMHLKGNEVRVSVTDIIGNPIKIGMSSATVFVHSDEENVWFKLYPDENNQLVGTGKFTVSKNLKFEVSIHLAGEKPFSVSFNPAISEKPTNIRQ